METTNTVQYRKAKPWQLYLFSIHDLLLICFLVVMNFITYLGAGYYGLLATTVAMIATASRIFDAITDPIIAFIVERTDGKFGRYRPTMVLGWIISAIALLGIYFFCVGASPIVFILIYAVYVIGYSFMMTSQGGARVAFTNEPVQRNRLGLFMGIFSSFFGMAFNLYNTNYLVPKHGGKIDLGTMQELCITMLVVSFIILVLTVVSIWDRDVPENYRSLSKEKVSPSDMFKVMKNNRNFQMILVACASDRIAMNIASNTSVIMAVWGIIAGNYAFYGRLGLIAFIPNILVSIFGNQVAIKMGKRTALRNFSIGSVVAGCSMIALFTLGDPTQIGRTLPMTAVYLLAHCVFQACMAVTNGLRMPMLADVADYEMSRNGGKQIAGVISAAYSLVDKTIVAFATTIVGFAYAGIGYVTSLPQQGDPVTGSLVTVSMILWMGLPIVGYILSIIAMKFYTLDNATMEDVQARLSAMKAAVDSEAKAE